MSRKKRYAYAVQKKKKTNQVAQLKVEKCTQKKKNSLHTQGGKRSPTRETNYFATC